MTARMMLFADFGPEARPEGPRAVPASDLLKDTLRRDRNPRAFSSIASCRRWWLVECENSEAGRKLIANYATVGNSGGPFGTAYAETCGRILDQGVNP